MDIAAWLHDLGLSQYRDAFEKNAIDAEILRELTAEDLKEMGVAPIGHRRKLLAAIAALRARASPVTEALSPPAPEAAATAERRLLTVMFCDLVGSTPLSARLDPEDLRDVLGAYHAAVAQEIARFGGYVAKYMGDGVLAYFGYPQAREEDAERALRAGLALAERIARLDTSGERLAARIGIATGLVVVGDLLGHGEAQERGVVGETPNLAARLQAMAEPGAVLIDERTRRLVGQLFECRDPGAVELRGIAGPVPVFVVLRPSAVESRFEALRAAALTPLVGREEEIGLLLRRWRRAAAGEGQVVLICGEPGIGKSRLTVALRDRLAGEDHAWLRYFTSPHHQDSALYPFIAQLERAALFEREDPPDSKLDKLAALLAPASPSAEEMALFAEEQIIPFFAAHGMVLRGWALVEQGQCEEGIARLREGIDAYRATGANLESPHWLALLAESCDKAGQTKEALSVVRDALAEVERTGIRYHEAELHRLNGEFRLGFDEAEAETCFHRALAIARTQQAKSFELRAALSLARLWRTQGKRDEARDLLTPLYGWFTEGFDTADLREAAALLDQLR